MGITLPWKSTFDCPEWTQSDWLQHYIPPNCDGISKGGDWTCQGHEAQITAAANMATGGGGNGYRNWIGDGTNNSSGALKVAFNTPQTELWFRWYIRYEAGFKWNSIGHKCLYFDMGGPASTNFYLWNWDQFKFHIYSPESDIYSKWGCGWDDMMKNGILEDGHRLSDGSWHCLEIHIKQESAMNAGNGIAEAWVGGKHVLSDHTVNWGDTSGWNDCIITAGAGDVNAPRCMAVDVDDIAINNTGYIGPLGIIPTPPQEIITPKVTNLTFSPEIIKENIPWSAITTVENSNEFPIENVRIRFYHRESPDSIFHTIEGIEIPASSSVNLETTFEPWIKGQYQLCAKVIG